MTEFTAISFRKGFATNSSSSHAIIMSPTGNFPKHDNYSGDYGWDWFVQQEFDSKLSYIYVAIHQQFNSHQALADHLNVSLEKIEEISRNVNDGYIDHDSYGTINEENAAMILHNDVLAIRGGNDNDDIPSYLEQYQEVDSGQIEMAQKAYEKLLKNGGDSLVIRNEHHHVVANKNVVTVFSPIDGTKTRYSTIGNSEVYLSFPELVDIKITDYCPYGCEYCYQDSTVDGQHANIQTLKDMAKHLSDNGTFELAIGGGEPTLHPNFSELIRYVKHDLNMVINYTTRNLTYFKMPVDEMKEHLSSIGGYAYSIDEKSDIDRFVKLVDYWLVMCNDELNRGKINSKYGFDNQQKFVVLKDILVMLTDKVSFQLVLGVLSREDYIDIVQHLNDAIENINKKIRTLNESYRSWKEIIKEHGDCRISGYWYFYCIHATLMLLGYKTTGRGSEATYDYSNNALSDIEFIFNTVDIGIDTSAAQHLTYEIEKYDIDERRFYTKEGVASCYIDAVANTMADSSYGTMVDLSKMDRYDPDTFQATFNEYQKKALNAIPVLTI